MIQPQETTDAKLTKALFSRTCGYAASSCLALYSGLWSNPKVGYSAHLLFLIPFGITFPFFLASSSLFGGPLGANSRREENHYFWHAVSFGALITLGGFIWYILTPPVRWPPIGLI